MWQHLTRLLLAAVVVGLVILTVSFFGPQLKKQREMEEENAVLASRRDDVKRQRDELAKRQRLLKTDPEYLEIYARDRLDLKREGETIIRIDRSPDPETPAF